MILVIGGIASGAREYALTLGYGEADMSSDPHDACPVLVDAQDLVRACDVLPDALAADIARVKRVVACRDVGNGIVPVERGEREWRERAGDLSRELAQRADVVVRVVCGIPQALKGDLPRASVELVVMRHGETEANGRREYTGWADVPLNAHGEDQAAHAGIHPEVQTVYVSSLQRARRTAEICFPQAHQIVDARLREMNFGAFEGRSARDMEDDADYRAWVDSYCTSRCPGGEMQAELTARVGAALRDIVADAVRGGAERAIVVGHGGTVMAAFGAIADSGKDYFEWAVGNCEGYRCQARLGAEGLVLEDARRFYDLGFLDEPAGRPKPGASFFANRACPYFPCHEGVDECDFNCMFCYCPLYALGPECGGDFTYTEKGRKNCTGCTLPHRGEAGAKLVAARYDQIAKLAARKDIKTPGN